MSSEETKRPILNFDFKGSWLPSVDPLLVGGKNFSVLQNQMPCANGLEGVPGYSKITNTPISDTYYDVRSGIQLRTKNALRSAIFLSARNSAGSASAILQQLATDANADIPNLKDFETTPVHIDAPGAGPGRFATWPNNQIAYCNGKETLVYGGPERPLPKFVVVDAPLSSTLTNPVDYTEAINNLLKTPGNVVRLGASVNTAVKMLLHGDDQADGSTTITDSSDTPHTFTAHGDAKISTSHSKFGRGCLSFAGTGWIDTPAHADFYQADTDFTLDGHFQFADSYPTGTQGLFGQYQDEDNYYFGMYQTIIPYISGVIKVFIKNAGTETTLSFSWLPTGKRYYHFCLQNISALDLTVVHIDGVPGTTAPLVTFPDLTGDFEMGRCRSYVLGSVTSFYLEGQMDEWRLTQGQALWPSTASFTVPSTAGVSGSKAWVVFSPRPIQAVKYYLSNANPIAGATITGRVWDGSAYTPLTLMDTTAGLTVDEGSTVFESTIDLARPRLLDGSYYYVYQFSISAGEAEIYRMTFDVPMQPIRDLWDGVPRPVLECRFYHGSVWTDATMNVVESTASGVTGSVAYVASVGGLTSTEMIDLAVSERACAFYILMYERENGKVNTAAAVLTPYVWNGSAFVAPVGIMDETAPASKTLAQSGHVSWTPPPFGEEHPKTERGDTRWRYRLMVSGTLSADVWIDKIIAIPAPQIHDRGYAFPFMFQNRPMLCNLVSTGEGNRVDYAVTTASEGWNGEDSSFGDGKQPLYLGDQSPLTCACEIYQRLSNSIYTFALFFKAYGVHILNGYDYESYKDYPLSDKIGCPAPETLDTYQIFTSREQQSSRSIAAWLSFQGPQVFDAGGISPIPGLECYFDPLDPRCINFAAIANSRGWWDPDRPQYNLQIPSGAGQITPNVWVVHDFRENRWYPKTPAGPSPYLSAVVRVADAGDKQYIYGARADGHLLRLEHDTTWDGMAIPQIIETGEIVPTGNLWDTSKIPRLKLYYKPLSEAANLVITMYRNGAEDPAGDVIATIPLQGTKRFARFNKKIDFDGAATVRFRFATATSASAKGLQLFAWSIKYEKTGIDDQ